MRAGTASAANVSAILPVVDFFENWFGLTVAFRAERSRRGLGNFCGWGKGGPPEGPLKVILSPSRTVINPQ